MRHRILRIRQESPQESVNGLLDDCVALETLLGNGPATWRFMLKHHRRNLECYCPLPPPGAVECAVK